jgi:S-adenosyl-L-methionine hydrolase (adenosine-forming)
VSRSIFALTTDFGLADGYVAQMKGVLLRLVPNAAIVDVTHDVPPQDVSRGAAVLDDVVEAFPPETIHVVVVDPGVGTDRGVLAVETAVGRFVAPDNGVLSHVVERFPPALVVECGDRTWWGPRVSATFHGRDVLAPLAAHWARGADPRAFGAVREGIGVRLPALRPERTAEGLRGRVLWADRFGNLVTSIRRGDLPVEETSATVRLAGRDGDLGPIRRTYADVAAGELLALFGSSDRLEIAVNGGSAAARLGWADGAERVVELRFAPLAAVRGNDG